MVSRKLKREIVGRLRKAVDPERVILFGSQAKGSTRPESDIDLLLIKQGVRSVRSEARRARAALRGLPAAFDVIVATPEQIERYGRSIGLIYRTALTKGEAWYEKQRGPSSS